MQTSPMNILIATPAPRGSRKGNRVTALRWAKFLRKLGHHVQIQDATQPLRLTTHDILIALHARKSHGAMRQFRNTLPDAPMLLTLTGTDLYDDIHHDTDAQQSLVWADRLIVLQESGIEELPPLLRHKARVVYQSVPTPAEVPPPLENCFEVCVVGHLREVKDPFRTAWAARLLPESSKLCVLQLGGALDPEMALAAREEEQTNSRYTWLGEQTHPDTLRIIARCRLLVLTSQLEGGANVISEALACGTPVISSHISGSIGLLGAVYPGYFPFGDTGALAALLWQAETDAIFYRRLQEACRIRRELVQPSHELATWESLLKELISKDCSNEENQ